MPAAEAKIAPEFNRLADQTSPYLLQHAADPVAWWPWCEEAWAQARARDCPVLLSIGYSACHWCHVMAHESFADPEIGKLLAGDFVAIKIDREQRPDVDAVYMAATQAMQSGRGGWPMTLLTTPTQKPFFAATYVAKEDAPGRIGFRALLQQVARMWREGREPLTQQAQALHEYLQGLGEATAQPPRDASAVAAQAAGRDQPWWVVACERLLANSVQRFDHQHGGFGSAPKFPGVPLLQLLLRAGWQNGDTPARALLTTTLGAMARGGMHDLVGGGFARYATDAGWHVPHFEKMLSDNAGLAQLYADAFVATKDASYAKVAARTLDFVLREMRCTGGAFACAIDADDSAGEGHFYSFTFAEAQAALQPLGDAQNVAERLAQLSIIADGNWQEGRNIPRLQHPWGKADSALSEQIAHSCAALFALRPARTPPSLDDKVLTGHNGLMLSALARGALALQQPQYLQAGMQAADFLQQHLRRDDGRLWRCWRDGRAEADGVLEDYAYLAQGLCDLYEAGAPLRYLAWAKVLCAQILAHFVHPQTGGFYDTADDAETLLFRPQDAYDGPSVSPHAVAANILRRMATHTGDAAWAKAAERSLEAQRANATAVPQAYASILAACNDAAQPGLQATLVPPTGDAQALMPLWQALGRCYLPHLTVAHGSAQDSQADAWPLVAHQTSAAQPQAILCANQSCGAPMADADAFARALQAFVTD